MNANFAGIFDIFVIYATIAIHYCHFHRSRVRIVLEIFNFEESSFLPKTVYGLNLVFTYQPPIYTIIPTKI